MEMKIGFNLLNVQKGLNVENMSDAKNHFIQGMSRIADFWGMPKAMGVIYGCIYLSSSPVSLDEMVDQSGLSKGSVSTNVRVLERLQMVRQEFRPGDRKDYYVAEPDLWRVVRGILEQRRKVEFSSALSSVNESLAMLDVEESSSDNPHEIVFQRERIRQMESFFRMLDKVVGGILLMNKLSASALNRFGMEKQNNED